jgi:hypothetical protein
MPRDDLATNTEQTVAMLNDKVREAVTLGKPTEAVEYANALQAAAGAYDYLDATPDDE